MKYRTVFRPDAQADLRKLDITNARAILAKLTELETDPFAFGTTELKSEPGVRRLRVGNFRVAYTVQRDELIVWVVKVAHRSVMYDSQG